MSTDDSNAISVGTALVEVKPPSPEVLDRKGNEALIEAGATQDEVARYLRELMPYISNDALRAIIPWFYDRLNSKLSRKEYSRDLARFWNLMRSQGIDELDVTDDHVKVFKGKLIDAENERGVRIYQDATVARYLTVIRRTYHYLATYDLVPWEVARKIQEIESPVVDKNSTPELSGEEARQFLRAIKTHTLKGKRDLALLWTYIKTACRVSALVKSRVGDLVYENKQYKLYVEEKGGRRAKKFLLDAAPAVLDYMEAAGITEDREGPLFRPMTRDGLGVEARHMNRRTPLRLVKAYCKRADIEAERLGQNGISPHSLRKTALNEAIRNGAKLEQVQALAGHRSITTTQLYYVQKDEDAEIAARCIHISPAAAE